MDAEEVEKGHMEKEIRRNWLSLLVARARTSITVLMKTSRCEGGMIEDMVLMMDVLRGGSWEEAKLYSLRCA